MTSLALNNWALINYVNVSLLTLSALEAKPLQTVPSPQKLPCLPFCFDFWLISLFVTMDRSWFGDGKVHFINSEWKGLKPRKDSSIKTEARETAEVNDEMHTVIS